VPLLKETFRLRKEKLSLDHPDTLLTMTNLRGCYRDTGRLPEATSLLAEALDRARKRPGGFPASLALVLSALASTYDEAGRFARAEPLHREVLQRTENQVGPNAPRTGGALDALGRNLLQQKNDPHAGAVLRRCLAIRARKQPDDWPTFNTRSLLGAALLGQTKYAEAEPLLREGYAGLKQREAKLPPHEKARLGEAAPRLVRPYEATGDQEKAAGWRQKLAAPQEAPKQTDKSP
jgi:tetratricopeptide (TPR) repeat protein